MEIGFNFPIIGSFLSTKIFISGDIIPEKNDNTNVIVIPKRVFTFILCLLEDPINIPRATPNKFPIVIKSVLYFISVNNSIFNRYFTSY